MRLVAKSLDAGLCPAEDQGMNVVRALVGIHHLEIDDMAYDAILVRDAVAAVHVARGAGDVERLAAGIALHHRRDIRRRAALVLQAPETQTALQAQGDFGLHVGELFLYELIGRERTAELLAIQGVLPR